MVLAGLWTAPLTSSANAATKGPTGNAAAIAFYRQVEVVTNRMGGLREVLSGYTALEEGPNGSARTVQPPIGAPAGYVPVAEHVVQSAIAGKEVWISDEMVPAPSCKAGFAGGCAPYMFLLDRAGMFTRSLRPGTPNCWAKGFGDQLAGNQLGDPIGETVSGDYAPMRRAGPIVFITSTHANDVEQWTDTDIVSYATHLPSAGGTHVVSTKTGTAYSFTWTVTWLARPPAEPVVHLCS